MLALVVSASFDAASWAPVKVELEHRGLEVLVFESDRVARGETRAMFVQEGTDLTARIGVREFKMQDVSAAWWRKPHWLALESADRLRKYALEHEVNRLQQSLWAMLGPDKWLNSPLAMRAAGSLNVQLAAAARCGLATPRTVVTNDWREVLPWADEQDLALKTLNGFFESDTRSSRNLFTQRVSRRELTALQKTAMPYPAIFQPFTEKRREWRVTVVGRYVFPVAVYTVGSGQVDWRREQGTENVKFVAEPLPAEVLDQCRSVTRELGLRFAAIDLIETDDGAYVFLEANPNGQYGWLDEEVGYSISRAIAVTLFEVAANGSQSEPQ